MILDQYLGVAGRRQFEQMVRQHHTDIQRILKRLPQFPQDQIGDNYPGGTGITGTALGLTFPAVGKHGAGTWTGGTSKTVTIYTGAGGSESATAFTVSAYLPAGLTIAANALCILDQVYGGTVYAHPHSC